MSESRKRPGSGSSSAPNLAALPAGPVCIVGAGERGDGRVAGALAAALRAAGVAVNGPEPRGATGAGAGVVILAVPDREIAAAAAAIAPGPLVGHCSGASGLDGIGAHPAFGLHPLTSIAGSGHDFSGGFAAVDGSTPQALAAAEALAALLGMRTFRVQDEDRAAYHAAASIASNYLVALEGVAEALAATAGVPRAALVPLVRSSVENWARHGARAALTGPIVRGDEETVEAQRAAVAERLPDRAALLAELERETRRLAAQPPTTEGDPA